MMVFNATDSNQRYAGISLHYCPRVVHTRVIKANMYALG